MTEQSGWPVTSVSWLLLLEEGVAVLYLSLLLTPRTPVGKEGKGKTAGQT